MDSMEKYQYVLKVEEIPTFTFLDNADEIELNCQQGNTLVIKPFKKYTQKIKIINSKREFVVTLIECIKV